MLDIGWSELLVIAIVAIVVVGPKDLPKLMRTIGFYAGKIRRTAADFQRQFQEAMAESEAEEVRKNIEAIRSNMGTAADFGAPLNKPLMTGEPARTALGAPPLDAQQAQKPAKRKRAPAKKTAKAAKTKSATPRKAKTAAKTPSNAKKAPKR
jgi:sec-independent protein translocase protein TatB